MICCPESGANISPRDELAAIVDELGVDEVRVLARIAARLLRGAEIYGRLDVADDDARDFGKKPARRSRTASSTSPAAG